uniref:Adhesion G protein-coupled receptor L3 n=1 Tax=Molossus molossus TaxID=27622 RepID=A0A7J8JPM5_MOLMO|nr:adhesion G protein-coupled receptor L3 [Molossus molossus]
MVASTASDIQPSLLRCDTLSAAREALYHPDISFSSPPPSAPPLIVDKGPVELPEESVVRVPKEPRSQPKVRPEVGKGLGVGGRGSWEAQPQMCLVLYLWLIFALGCVLASC